MTSFHCWWGWLAKFWLAFYRLHDIPNIDTKFDRQTVRQTETGDHFFRTRAYWTFSSRPWTITTSTNCDLRPPHWLVLRAGSPHRLKTTRAINIETTQCVRRELSVTSHRLWAGFTGPNQKFITESNRWGCMSLISTLLRLPERDRGNFLAKLNANPRNFIFSRNQILLLAYYAQNRRLHNSGKFLF